MFLNNPFTNIMLGWDFKAAQQCFGLWFRSKGSASALRVPMLSKAEGGVWRKLKGQLLTHPKEQPRILVKCNGPVPFSRARHSCHDRSLRAIRQYYKHKCSQGVRTHCPAASINPRRLRFNASTSVHNVTADVNQNATFHSTNSTRTNRILHED